MKSKPTPDASARLGVIYGLIAYTLWGVFPLYFKAMKLVSPWEILFHRVCWSALLLVLIVTLQARWRELWQAIRQPRTFAMLVLSSVLIASNWITFLMAVQSEQVLQASLGYFLTPLMNVLLGVTVLRERLRLAQIASVGLATIAVATMTWIGGQFPWIAITLAVTFAFYGLCRKTVAVDSVLGLAIETLLLVPVSLVYLFWLYRSQTPIHTPIEWTLLALSGVVTATPLLLFAGAARRLRLVTIGFLQYLGPTLQFGLAILVFHEPLNAAVLVSFAFIWIAVGLYSADSVLAFRRATSIPRPVYDPLPLEDL